MRNVFEEFHPIVTMIYFFEVLVYSMFLMHPICLWISLGAAIAFGICLGRKMAVGFQLKFMIPMIIAVMLINPAFNHRGMTILTYLPSGNPLTLESIVYGAASACLMASVIQWFACYKKVMTSDKFIYLFGKVLPSLSLVLSMCLRFVPRFYAQFHLVREAQRCIGKDISNGSFLKRMKNGVRIFSVMISWSMENAIETADSMKGRGYGLPGRTAFSIYHFERRDGVILGWILFLGAYLLTGLLKGGLRFWYFPMMNGRWGDLYTVTLYIVYGLLCFLPVMAQLWGLVSGYALEQKNKKDEKERLI